MPTNAMGREAANPGKGTGGRTGTNAAKDRAAVGGMLRGTSDLAAERSRLRGLGADFITPKYSWDQARISDFGITGGLMNGLRGILNSNTYAGRMPQGLRAAFSSDGNRGGRPMRSVLPPAPMALPPGPQAPPVLPKPIQMGPSNLNVPGGFAYGVNIPGYSYFK